MDLASYDGGQYFGCSEFGNIPSTTSIIIIESSSSLYLLIRDFKAIPPKDSESKTIIFEDAISGVEKQGQTLYEAIQQ